MFFMFTFGHCTNLLSLFLIIILSDGCGRYDLDELSFRSIIDVQFVSAMGNPVGGKCTVTNRYLRHFHVICATAFSDLTMNRSYISTTILLCILVPFLQLNLQFVLKKNMLFLFDKQHTQHYSTRGENSFSKMNPTLMCIDIIAWNTQFHTTHSPLIIII